MHTCPETKMDPIFFPGDHCELSSASCRPSPCKNNGTCNLVSGLANCTCSTGWTGFDCGSDVDECASTPCVKGRCVNTPGSYACVCDGGFTGQHCELHVTECTSAPCRNHGTCIDVVNGYRCACTASFSGQDCEVPLNDCSGNPCQNGGNCRTGSNKFSCTCQSGFTGFTCEDDVNECARSPCLHGSCVNTPGSFSCRCADGYRGRYCEYLYIVSFQQGAFMPASYGPITTEKISFDFRTTLPDGLLLYQAGVRQQQQNFFYFHTVERSPFTPNFKKYILPTFQGEMLIVRIGIIILIIFHLS